MTNDDHTRNLLARVAALQAQNRYFGEQLDDLRRHMESAKVGEFVERREFVRRQFDRLTDMSFRQRDIADCDAAKRGHDRYKAQWR